jgi:hypothetical protein
MFFDLDIGNLTEPVSGRGFAASHAGTEQG